MDNKTTKEMQDAAAAILAQAGIVFAVALMGATVRREREGASGWKCDQWRYSFTRGKETHEGDYFTGTGLRKPLNGAPADKGTPNTLYRESWEKQWLRPVAPCAVDVLHSLLLDSDADGMSFRNWAGDFGYSDDSIDALETYRTCCRIAVELRRVCTPEVIAQLRTALEGY